MIGISPARTLCSSSFVCRIRLPRGDCFPLPKSCYNGISGSQAEDMRITIRLLAILTMVALLAPSTRWASLRSPAEECACSCPPGACRCAGHHHPPGHLPGCCAGKGGKCGMDSQDNYLASILSTLIYAPTEHPWWNPLAPWSCDHDNSHLSLLPSHVRIPEQPPRATL